MRYLRKSKDATDTPGARGGVVTEILTQEV